MNIHARPVVVKYGGNALPGSSGPDAVLDELAMLDAAGQPLVLVHGGGPEIDAELARRGIETRRVDGLRVTDAPTLAVTEAVLCASVNKRLVRALQERGVRSAGISGQDGPTLVGTPFAGGKLGFVGQIERVDPSLLEALIAARFVPVVAPLATSSDGALNVNADLSAAAIAAALDARAVVFITNVDRVLRDTNDASSGIDRMSADEATDFHRSPFCADGMKPKIEAAIAAARRGVDAYVAGAGTNAIARALEGEATLVTATA